MKTDLDRNQLIGVAGCGLGGLVAGGLAWLGLSRLGEKQEQIQVLADQMINPSLAALVVDPDGPNRAGREAADIQKMATDLQNSDALANQWLLATRELAGEGTDWAKDPGKWKDRLITIQSQLQKEATEAKVQMASDFYLGLDGFRQKSPTTDEVPALALHLSVAERLIQRLLEARKVPEQYPTDCEILSLVGPGSVPEGENQERPSAGSTPGAKAGIAAENSERKKFRLEIRCSPEVLYKYVKLLARDPALLIIANLSVLNEKQSFPLRSEIAKGFSEVSPPSADKVPEERKESKRLLEILAGEESLRVVFQIDFVPWKKTEMAQGRMPKAAKP